MRFAQFWQMSVNWDGKHPSKPIQAVGDRSVIILDARKALHLSEAVARLECRKRGYIGYSMHEGKSFTEEKTVKKYQAI